MAALSRRSRCDNKKTISLCLAWCAVLWLTLSGFRTEADEGQLRETDVVTTVTVSTTLSGVLVTFIPATVLSPAGETVWSADEGRVRARMPLLLTASPASFTAAPVDGYFRTVCDGWETIWDVPAALFRSPAEVAASLAADPLPPAKAKLEEGFERYFLLLVQKNADIDGNDNGFPIEKAVFSGQAPDLTEATVGRVSDDGGTTKELSAALPEEGRSCSLQTEAGQLLRVTLLSRAEQDGYLLLRFSASASPALDSLPRISPAALCLAEETALSFPASALLCDDAGQACVLCDRGDRAVARAVRLLGFCGTQALCAEGGGKTTLFGQSLPCLSAGDHVITDPAGLTHRSLLHRKHDPLSYLRFIIENEKEKKEDTP